MVWTTYKERIKRLSSRLVEAQRPIRILDAIKWDDDIESELIRSKYREMPKIDVDYYSRQDLGFDPQQKLGEFRDIADDVRATLGKEDPLCDLLASIAEEYRDVVHLLLNRGKREFWEYSRKLYGSPKDKFNNSDYTVHELGDLLYRILSGLDDSSLGPAFREDLDAKEAVRRLNDRFKDYFSDDPVRAKLSDGIIADASAGGDSVKIREGAKFSTRDVRILEVHEGWVHVGTSLNGARQRVAKWLSKGPPRVSATQEGLAVIMEIFTFNSYPRRARAINDRILGIHKAEDGANLLELIEFYRTEGYSEEDCFTNAKRVCRGGMVTGGAPFTKDISYCRGFIENYNFLRAAIRAGKPEVIPLIFAGKLHVDDVPLVYQKYREGIVDYPAYLPKHFKDLNGLAVWMSFSSFLNLVDLGRVQAHYDKLFREFG